MRNKKESRPETERHLYILFSGPLCRHLPRARQGNLQRAAVNIDIHRRRFRLCGGGRKLGIDLATPAWLEGLRAVVVSDEIGRISSDVGERNGTDRNSGGAIVGHGYIMMVPKPDPGVPEIDDGRGGSHARRPRKLNRAGNAVKPSVTTISSSPPLPRRSHNQRPYIIFRGLGTLV